MVLPDVKPSTYIKTPITSGLFGGQDVNEGWFMSNVRILIVDDKQLVRDGLRIFLESHDGMTICGEAADGLEGIRKAFELKPDVILLDLSMPTLDGLKAAQLIREGSPKAEILIVTSCHSLEAARIAAEVGASGYVTKSLITSDLVPAIEEAVSRHAA
jgi:two-component system nitrate/nitrite response regulator NarL